MTQLKIFSMCFIFLLITATASAQPRFEGNLHYGRLNVLKKNGYEPQVIYDIGAYQGFWSKKIQKLFPKSQFYLFEACEENRKALESTPFPFFISLLGDDDKMVSFYSNGTTGDSVFCEQTKYYSEADKKLMPMVKLSTLVQNQKLPLPDLIKMDVQGAEKLILQGSPEVISHAELIILEAKILEYNKGAPLIFEMMTLMDSLGYSLLDLLECHYLPSGELNEVDLLFAKKDSKLIKKGMLIE